jgi:hypothetical protein
MHHLLRTTIITLKPCALNAEFPHFILGFNKNFLTLQIPLKEWMGVKKRVTLWITLMYGDYHKIQDCTNTTSINEDW